MVELTDLTKIYQSGKREVTALDGIDLRVRGSEFFVVRGPSGSGKTTLLLSIGGMLNPTSGSVLVEREDIYHLTQKERTTFRRKNIGFVFQMFHLLPYLNVLDNIRLGQGIREKRDENGAMELLEQLGLNDRGFHTPPELSAGECQRVAIARALYRRPRIILADEPTGNLDPECSSEVMECLWNFQQNGGTVIVVTHGTEAERWASRVVRLERGRVVEG